MTGPKITLDRTVTVGNIVTALVFIVGFCIQFVVMDASVREHEKQLQSLESRVRIIEDVSIRRGSELTMVNSQLARILSKMDRQDEWLLRVYQEFEKKEK